MKAYLAKGGAAPAAAAPAAAAAAPAKLTSDIIFAAITHHIETHPDLVGKVQTIFQWKLTGPDSQWAIDLRNGKGSCVRGTAEKPDVTMELSDADFLAMSSEPDGMKLAMKLYMGGKLKISGNVMASQKLGDVLKGIDREAAMKAYLSKSGAAPQPAAASPAPAAPPAAPKAGKTAAIFDALKDRLGKTPALAKEVGQVLAFKVKDAGKSYVVDLTGAGAVSEGASDKAAATFTLEDEDLVALVKDPQRAKDLYMHGKLRADGDARLAQKLGFLKDLV
jgi:3-hydroxyacyl-CoA dehydrogenase/3a,7a,12a-trihydroxy-5b-cholest-24-enoyl-CoA hydratase